LARYLPSGNIEFLGRIDHQVKIRGFRIELGEIEAVLGQHPAVREAVVIDREDQPGNKRLVAYVVPNREQAPPAPPALFTDLRGFLKQKLPEYMIPSAFVLLKALPLMPNGKVDRQALPIPDAARSELDGTFVAPRTLNEQRLAQIWAEVLGRKQVGIHDNFFEVGGDSILSMQVIAKSNQAGIQLTPKQLFEYQTIAELAAVAGTAPALYAEQGIVMGQVPLTPIQHWFFEQNRTEPHHFNQAVLLEVRQPLDPGLLEQAVQHLLVHHDALRLRFVPEESGWRQVNASPDEIVPFTLIDLSALQEPKQGSALEAKATELQASLNLQEGPLVRVALFNKGVHKSSRLLIVIHHLAVDGVSWRILLEDLQTAYQQLSSGEEVQLPPKTTSFQQWAYRVREYANSAAQEQRDYWLAEFPKQVPRLPVDYPGGDNTVARARTVSVTLSEAETQALLLEVPSSYNTQINDVLLTALVQAFGQWTGVPSLLVDLEGHGREDIFDDMDLSRTVGWFTSIFPVLLDLGETGSPGKALKAVKEQLRGIPNRGIGYGLLRYLSDDREMSLQLRSLPQAEVSFNYLGQFDQALSESSLFGLAQESSGLSCSLSGNRSYLIDINGFVAGGQLRLDWTYSEQIHRQSTIERLAQGFRSVLRSLIAHCRAADATESVAALNADAVLDSTIVPENLPVEYSTEPAHIFLTGATGFLGAFLLYEFLQQTQADIYCLVRARNAEEGKKRLQSQLEFYSLWNESLSSRIIPVVGDLSQPLLGLSDEQFQELANKLDVIYHNGTAINLVYPYSILKATNVLGTQEILRLACLIKAKPVHYISTLAVLSSLNHPGVKVIRELDSLEHVGVPYGGYAQSKWVAEKLVTTARDRGLPVCIYRLGRISGHSQSGVCNTNDFMHRAIKGCIQLGCAPDVDMTVDMNPVDYVSKAIVHLSRQKESLGKAFHVFNPHPIRASELFNGIRSLGYPLRQVSHDKWQAELLNAHEDSLKNVLYPLLPFFAGSASDSANPAVPQDDCQNTLNGLAGTSIVCPPIDGQLLDTYFSYLIRIGFLDAPRKREMYR
jgi:thioester reductase-like protein/non-ribosomal peptide synthase protein (TIGR01720 family)